MKILNSKQPSMDNKLKFSDRFKVLENSDTQKGIDPYVFNDTEQPFVKSTGGKNIKLIAPKNSKVPSTTNRTKSKGKVLKTKIKTEPVVFNAAIKTEIKSEIDSGTSQHFYQPSSHESQQKQRYLKKLQRLKSKRKNRDHTLQYYPRAGDEISDSESSGDELQTYQRHWYSGEYDPSSARSSRLFQLHSQLERQLKQLKTEDENQKETLKRKTRCLLQAAAKDPSATARILSNTNGRTKAKIADGPLIVGAPCGAEGCQQLSLPCTRHCSRHIMLNSEQLLFQHCTAKFSDNTQCSIPVFDVAHELPLCPEHARKRDNYHRRAQESKPKKSRSSGSSSSKRPSSATDSSKSSKSKSRPKKKKRPPSRTKQPIDVKPPVVAAAPVSIPEPQPPVNLLANTSIHHPQPHHHNNFVNSILSADEINTKTLNNLNVLPQAAPNAVNSLNTLGLDIGSLGLPGLKVELDDHEVFASLDHTTEHDFENVLNNLPADAFNDLFIEGRNGEYEPSREEEEELERAVEAFDKDVRNLERLGQTHGLLEPALLAQLMSDIAS